MLERVAQGLSHREIADKLVLNTRTEGRDDAG